MGKDVSLLLVFTNRLVMLIRWIDTGQLRGRMLIFGCLSLSRLVWSSSGRFHVLVAAKSRGNAILREVMTTVHLLPYLPAHLPTTKALNPPVSGNYHRDSR